MTDMGRNQKNLGNYKSFLFEVIQEVSSIYQSLNNAKLKLDCHLNHLTKLSIMVEQSHSILGGQLEIKAKLKEEPFIKYFIFYLVNVMTATMNKIKQNTHLLKENQLMQQKQIKEEYEL